MTAREKCGAGGPSCLCDPYYGSCLCAIRIIGSGSCGGSGSGNGSGRDGGSGGCASGSEVCAFEKC